MRKSLLLLSCALSVGAFMYAENASKVYPEMFFTNVSRNGQWVAGQLSGSVHLVNVVTGEVQEYAGDGMQLNYSVGNGVAISDDGMLVGSTDNNNGAYLKDGVWTPLPTGSENELFMYVANDITPDGSRICGGIGGGDAFNDEVAMIYPCVWDVKADGTYGDPVMLPCPKLDFTGRTPQYIMCVSMSADGKTIAGQMTDYFGSEHQGLLFKEDADGKWTCTEICPELINPDGVEFPPAVGESPQYVNPQDFMTMQQKQEYAEAEEAYNAYQNNRPQLSDFMSADSRLDYEEALAAYYEDNTLPYPLLEDYASAEEKEAYTKAIDDFYANAPEYPVMSNYMSEDKKAEYLAKQEAYEAEYAVWDEAFTKFNETYHEVLESCPQYVMNAISISSDGTKVQCTGEVTENDPMTWTSTSTTTLYAFDLEKNSVGKLLTESPMLSRQIFDDGSMLVNTYPQSSAYDTAYFLKAGSTEIVPLAEYLTSNDAELKTWIDENMVHDVESFDMETYETVVLPDQTVMGQAIASADMKTIASYATNVWDYDDPTYFYSYILLPGKSGVFSAVADASALGAAFEADGTLVLTGDVTAVTVYDLNGRVVYAADAPTATLSTGLNKGVYVVKVAGPAGAATVKAVL